MPSIPRGQLERRSSSTKSYYAIVFAVVGSVILISGLFWGYLLPKWQKKHHRPVQTRYNCTRGTRKQQAQPDHDLELPVIFPPHPAVVIPLNTKRQPKDSGRVPCTSSIPVYDPRTQSPFPNTPSAGCSRPLTADASLKHQTALPATTTTNRHNGRMQRSQSHHTPMAIYDTAFPSSRSTSIGHANTTYVHNNSTNDGRRSFLVARSAGAPPARSKAASKAVEELGHHGEGRNAPTTISEDTLLAVTASDHRHPSKGNHFRRCDFGMAPGVASVAGNNMKEQVSRNTKRPLCTPSRSRFDCHDIFETPSSRGTTTTTRFESSRNRIQVNSTPPTRPNSSIIQPRYGISPYPGISKLVPSRKFSHQRRTPSADVVPERSPVSSLDANESNHPFIRGHRPVSAPPSSSRRTARMDQHLPDHPSLPESDSITDIHLQGKVSANSQKQLDHSLDLFPRPLTFRRTVASPSPLVSPTPIGRHQQEAAFSKDYLCCEHVEERPMTRGKSPRFKRRSSVSSVLCLPNKQETTSATHANHTFGNLEGYPFTHRIGLARLGSNTRRSSLASLSTLKIPRSFRPSISRGGSSIYSCDFKGMTVPPSPGVANGYSVSLQSLPQPIPVPAASYDETLLRDADQESQDAEAKHYASPNTDRETQFDEDHRPQTPSLPIRNPLRGTPQIGTASSDTFGTKMSIPRVTIARSSDDVFGATSMTAKRRDDNTVVVEDGRTFKKVKAMESKLSQEDLMRYGGRTAPGGVEWF